MRGEWNEVERNARTRADESSLRTRVFASVFYDHLPFFSLKLLERQFRHLDHKERATMPKNQDSFAPSPSYNFFSFAAILKLFAISNPNIKAKTVLHSSAIYIPRQQSKFEFEARKGGGTGERKLNGNKIHSPFGSANNNHQSRAVLCPLYVRASSQSLADSREEALGLTGEENSRSCPTRLLLEQTNDRISSSSLSRTPVEYRE